MKRDSADATKSSQIDVLILTAIKDELDVIINLEGGWQMKYDSSDYPYNIKEFVDYKNNKFFVALARPVDMGGVFTANLASRLVKDLKPRCLAMAGICAGRRGEVLLGDVIVADRVFQCDGGKLKAFKEGNFKKEEVFHDIRTYNLKFSWKMRAEDFPEDWIKTINKNTKRPCPYRYQQKWVLYAIDAFENTKADHPKDRKNREKHCPDWAEVIPQLIKKGCINIDVDLKLTEKGKKWVSNHKIIYLEGLKPDRQIPKSHVAPMGTGTQVKEDPDLFSVIEQYERNTLAVEMEAAAVGAVAEIEGVDSCIIVKSVSDYGDGEKDDHFRDYAIETSYRFLIAFLKKNLPSKPKKKIPFLPPQVDISTFTGRDKELKQLEEVLVKGKVSNVCCIFGMSGVGKSALASHFAKQHKEDFPDGIIGLRVDGKDVDTIAREFAWNYGKIIDSDDERNAAAIMQELFGHRRLLLIFDNADNATIRSLIPDGDKCAVIVTTRDRVIPALLDIPIEKRIELLPLPSRDSRLLLESLLGKERVSSELESACNIIELVGRLPLALKIVGTTLKEVQPWRSLVDYEQALSKERKRLEQLKIHGEIDLNVQASISLSLKFLEQTQIDFFACLSVCAESGFSLQAAMAASNCDESVAHDHLGLLYRFSLLNRASSNRFVFHSVIFLFAKQLAVERSLREDAAQRHARYYIEYVKSSNVKDPSVASFIAEEMNDIIRSAQWLLLQEKADFDFINHLIPFFNQYGHWEQAVDLLSGFISSFEHTEDWNGAVQLRILQAKYLSLRCEWLQAQSVLDPIGGILDKIEKQAIRRHYEAIWLITLGGVLQRQGRLEEAEKAFTRSLEIGEKIGDERGQGMVLNSLGGVLQRQGRLEEAVKAFTRSLEIGEKIGDERGLGMVLNSLGGVLQRQGRLEEGA